MSHKVVLLYKAKYSKRKSPAKQAGLFNSINYQLTGSGLHHYPVHAVALVAVVVALVVPADCARA